MTAEVGEKIEYGNGTKKKKEWKKKEGRDLREREGGKKYGWVGGTRKERRKPKWNERRLEKEKDEKKNR